MHTAVHAQDDGDAGEGLIPDMDPRVMVPSDNFVNPYACDDLILRDREEEEKQDAPQPSLETESQSDQGDGGGIGGDPGGTDGDGNDSGVDGRGSYEDDLNTVGDPIDLRLADKRHVQLDHLSGGPSQLRVARVYHSNPVTNPAQVLIPMGAGWRNYYDRSVQALSGNQVRLHRANGRVIDFVWSGSDWASAIPGGALAKLATGGWQYVNDRNQIEIYSANGRLQSLSIAGLATTMQYDAYGRLIAAVNAFGRSLSYGYDGAGRVATITLPDGSSLGYGYDANNNLVSTRFGDGATRQYVYENSTYRNALTGVIDESGRRRLTWGYDGSGRPNYHHYGNGVGRVSISYNGNQVTTSDARGTQRTRTYGAVGPRTVLTALQTSATMDSPATGWRYGYDNNGNMANVVSRTGEVRQLSIDRRGRTQSATRAAGTGIARTVQTAWHPVFRQPVQTVAAGVTRNYAVDSVGRITGITAVASNGAAINELQKVYNAQGLLASVTDARGATTRYSYDGLGNLASATNALNQTTTYSNYNAFGQPGQVVRPDGTVVTRTYDTRGRLVARSVAGQTTNFAYDASGRLVKTTAPDGSWTQNNYDAAGFLASTVNHRGENSSYVRDATGKVVNLIVRDAAGNTTGARFVRYNTVGRLAAVLDSKNNQTQITYSADGRHSGHTDPLGRSYGVQRDLLDRPFVLSQPNTSAMRQQGKPAVVSTSLSYHASYGTVQTVTDTAAVATGYAFDAFARSVAEAGQDAGAKGWVRSGAGDVTSVTDARGVTTIIARDALGRVTTVTPPAGTAPINISYVPGRSDSLPALMTDPSGRTSWSYDSLGRLVSKTQTVGGIARTLTWARDSLGRVTRMTYPSGMRVDVNYSADKVSSIAVNGQTLLDTLTYLPLDQTATRWRWRNGSYFNRTFDVDGRMTSVTLGATTRSYIYDAAGRITGSYDSGPQDSQSSSFTYDEAGQLIAHSGPSGAFAYTYDTNGNRLSANQYGYVSSYSYIPNTNRLQTGAFGAGYNYNADGNPNYNGIFTFEYNGHGRLTTATGTNYKSIRRYNGQGMRVSSDLYYNDPTLLDGSGITKTGGNQIPAANWTQEESTQFVHDDQGNLLGEYSSITGYTQETVWFNGHPVATMINNTLYNVSVDNIGTPRVLARASDNLEVWRWTTADPFGMAQPTNPVASLPVIYNLRFPGQQYDAALNYNYNWMRDYDPQSGRYVQADPLGLGGGLSRYAYVGGILFQGLTRMACKRRAVEGAALAHASTSTNSRIKSSRTVPAQRPTWLSLQAQKRSGPCPRLRASFEASAFRRAS